MQSTRYPNFIGTIDSFFSRFIANPWIISHGGRIRCIDDDVVLYQRLASIKPNFRNYIKHRNLLTKLQYWDNLDELSLGNLGEDTRTYKFIQEAVWESMKQGYFTYREILLIAKRALMQVPRLSIILSKRFPFIFLDEAQDTNSIQAELINMVTKNSIFQAFGDSNQAIFTGPRTNQEKHFPREHSFIIPDTRRFSSDISSLVNPLLLTDTNIVGNHEPNMSSNNTIFIFDKSKIDRVLPAFGELVLQSIPFDKITNGDNSKIYAVGLVHKKVGDPKAAQFPLSVHDYYGEYHPNHGNKNQPFFSNCFIDYVFQAQYLRSGQRNWYSAVVTLVDGILRMANMISSEKRYRVNGSVFGVFHSHMTPESLHLFKKLLLKLLDEDYTYKARWDAIMVELKTLLSAFGNGNVNETYIKWVDKPENSFGRSDTIRTNNVYVYKTPKQSVNINLGSIHEVKGQTHLATLVLETFFRTHCLQRILPIMCGDESASEYKSKPQIKYLIKTAYVAMTRPRHLLCLAIPKDEIDDEQIYKLKKNGWKFQRLE